jgi:hypothetical protein
MDHASLVDYSVCWLYWLCLPCGVRTLCVGDGTFGGGWLVDCREINFDFHVIANQDTAALQRSVPVQIKIFAVDRRFSGQPCTLHAVEVFDLAAIFGIEGHLLRYAANGQVAGNFVLLVSYLLNFGTFEGKFRMVVGIEEIGGAQVSVTPLVARIYAGGVSLGLNPRIRGVLLINVKLSANDFKLSLDGANHHVTYRKGNL